MRKKHAVYMQSGGMAHVEFVPSMPLHDFVTFGPAIRIIVKPSGVSAANARLLETGRPLHVSDAIGELSGGIGYLGGTISKVSGEKKPVFIVWVRQDRVPPELPKSVRVRFERWDTTALNIAETEARRMGFGKLMVISKGSAEKTVNAPKILGRIYGEFEARVKRLGYETQEVEVHGNLSQDSYRKKVVLLVKNL